MRITNGLIQDVIGSQSNSLRTLEVSFKISVGILGILHDYLVALFHVKDLFWMT